MCESIWYKLRKLQTFMWLTHSTITQYYIWVAGFQSSHFFRETPSRAQGLVMAAPDTQAHAWKSFAKYVEKKMRFFQISLTLPTKMWQMATTRRRFPLPGFQLSSICCKNTYGACPKYSLYCQIFVMHKICIYLKTRELPGFALVNFYGKRQHSIKVKYWSS